MFRNAKRDREQLNF